MTKPPSPKPAPILVHVANLSLNKTYIQKFLAGSWLFCKAMGQVEGFEDVVKRKGLKMKNVEVVE